MAKRLTYPDKTNNASDPDSINKYFATEANEVKEVTDDHATRIETLEGKLVDSPNPFYGRYTSLAYLEAAYPTGEENAWAVIDAGVGITPQIAFWDDEEEVWEISGATESIMYVANVAALPGTGTVKTWYITLDKKEMYLYYNSQYILMNGGVYGQSTSPITVISASGAFSFTIVSKPNNVLVFRDGAKQIQHPDRHISYSSATGVLSSYIDCEGGEIWEIWPFGVGLRVSQQVEATSDNQSTYNFSGNPANLCVYYEGYKLKPSHYTRTYYSTGNSLTITDATILSLIKEGDIIDIDKF